MKKIIYCILGLVLFFIIHPFLLKEYTNLVIVTFPELKINQITFYMSLVLYLSILYVKNLFINNQKKKSTDEEFIAELNGCLFTQFLAGIFLVFLKMLYFFIQ